MSFDVTVRRRGRGFTLIELLVVVAIIAMLIAMLLPSLSKARETARTVACSAVLKSYGAANSMYADAWEGVHAPPWAKKGALRWYRNMSFRQMMGMTGTNWESSEGVLCPAAPEDEFTGANHQLTRAKTPWASHWDHVYANQIYRIVTGPHRKQEEGIFIRRAWITHPALKYNFVDATNYEVGGVTRINGVSWRTHGDHTSSRGGSNHIAYRHGEMGLNALHYDGHAAFYSFAEAWPTSTAGQDRNWLIYPKVK